MSVKIIRKEEKGGGYPARIIGNEDAAIYKTYLCAKSQHRRHRYVEIALSIQRAEAYSKAPVPNPPNRIIIPFATFSLSSFLLLSTPSMTLFFSNSLAK